MPSNYYYYSTKSTKINNDYYNISNCEINRVSDLCFIKNNCLNNSFNSIASNNTSIFNIDNINITNINSINNNIILTFISLNSYGLKDNLLFISDLLCYDF